MFTVWGSVPEALQASKTSSKMPLTSMLIHRSASLSSSTESFRIRLASQVSKLWPMGKVLKTVMAAVSLPIWVANLALAVFWRRGASSVA